MRIKSYFDSSIQTAMRQARQEFGDDVMLVTSRIAPSEFRQFGDYEVVFAVDGNETGPKAGSASQPGQLTTGFGEIFRQQLAPGDLHLEDTAEAVIGAIQSSLAQIGIDGDLAESVLALIRSSAPGSIADSDPCYASDSPSPVPGYAIEHDDPFPRTTHEEPDPAHLPAPGNRHIARTRRVPAVAGFVVMLLAFGLYGITRRSGG